MSNALFETGRNGFLHGDVAWAASAVIKGILVDLSQMGPTVGAWQITNVSNATNPTITTSAAHGLSVGNVVAISGVGGATGVNGNWTVASVPTSTTFTVTTSAPGAYTSGGFLMNLSAQFVSNLGAGGTVSNCGALTNMTTGGDGVASADSITFSAVTNSGRAVQGVVLYQASAIGGGADVATSSQRLIAWYDNLTGFPLVPSGADIQINWQSSSPKMFKL